MKKLTLFIVLSIVMLFGRTEFARSQNAHSQDSHSQDSLSIERAVELALANAPSIQRAMALTDAAHARTAQIGASNKPQLDADATYTRIDPVPTVTLPLGGVPTTLSFAPNDVYDVSANLRQTLYDFGKTHAAEAASVAGEQSAKDNVEALKSVITFQVVQAYFLALTYDQTIAIEEQQKVILGGNLTLAKEREHEGTATALDPLSTSTRIAAIESQEADIRASRQKQLSQLRRLIGYAPGRAIVLGKSPRRPTISMQLDSLLGVAKSLRADLILAKDAEESARLQIEAARLSNPPSLIANINAGVKDGYFPVLTKPYANWAGTVKFSVPILEGGRTEQKVSEAEANYAAAKAQTAELLWQIQSDVESAKADLDASTQKITLTQVQIDQAKLALSVAEARYKNGAATNLEYLTAQSALEQAELQQAQTEFNYALNIFNVKRAIGQREW